jgi:hypothetical protein
MSITYTCVCVSVCVCVCVYSHAFMYLHAHVCAAFDVCAPVISIFCLTELMPEYCVHAFYSLFLYV